jgi:hypothetical protein
MTVLGAHVLTWSVIAFGLLFLLASEPLLAKGQLVLIEISGATLGTPVRITDAKIENFSPWAGPGTNPEVDGFVVDWHRGRQTAGQRTPTLRGLILHKLPHGDE